MARLLFEMQAVRTRRGPLAAGTEFVVYTDSAGTVLADISATIGGSSIAGSTVTVADIPGLGPSALQFYGPPDNTEVLYLRCPSDASLGVQELEADVISGGGTHPNLATHDALGLATDAELATHAGAADPHTGYVLESAHTLATHDTLGLATNTDLIAVISAAPGDARRVTNAAMTASSATLTSATIAFVAGDVGKTVVVQGAGAAGVPLKSTVLSIGGATTATLAATASTTVTGKEAVLGTDATATLAADLVTAAGLRPVKLLPGSHLVTGPILDGNAVIMYALEGARTERGTNAEAARAGYAATKILFRPVDQSKRLIRAYDTTSPASIAGPYWHRNLTFDVGDANGLQFGLEDIDNDGISDPPGEGTGHRYVFGVHFEHCAFVATNVNRVSNGSGQITRSGRILLHLTKCFESTVSDVSFSGGDTQVRTWGCDKPTFRNVRSQFSHLPFDFAGAGTFSVQHVLEDAQVEGWTFTPVRISAVGLMTTNCRFEQNDGSPAGGGRYTLPACAVTADSGTLTFASSMTNVLIPNLSLVELTDGTTTTAALVTAVSGVTVTIDTSSTVLTWTDATADATRIHGYGPISTGDSMVSHSGTSPGASPGCPAFVYVVGKGALRVAGCLAEGGAYGDFRSLIIGNRFAAQSQMQSLATFDGCSPLVAPPAGHPFARVTNSRVGYGYANGDTSNTRAFPADLAEDVAAVRRVWTFTPRSAATANDSSHTHPFVRLPGDTDTEQRIWAWHKRSVSLLLMHDKTLPSVTGTFIRLRFRARSVTGTATVQWYFYGNGGGGGQSPTVGTTWTTFEYILALPAPWQGTNTVARAVVFADTGYYLAGCTVEELTTSDQAYFPAGVTTLVKAGAVSDADFTVAPPNGTIGIDTTNSKIYVRIGGTWKATAALT